MGLPVQSYCDELSNDFVNHIADESLSQIYVLEQIESSHLKNLKILEKRGVKVEQLNFFSGKIKYSQNESVPYAARRLSAELANIEADRIINNDRILTKVARMCRGGSIKNWIAKSISLEIEWYLCQSFVVKKYSEPKEAVLFLKRPMSFCMQLIQKAVPGVKIQKYNITCKDRKTFKWAMRIFRILKNNITRIAAWHKPAIKRVNNKNIFMLQEDDMHTDFSVRNQLQMISDGHSIQQKLTLLFCVINYMKTF